MDTYNFVVILCPAFRNNNFMNIPLSAVSKTIVYVSEHDTKYTLQ